ncbi:MAG TPA: Ig-like domain-containing protein [Saprospiraceae bacterium]|nr:Ig-like domain-containing protein [Saprospiraceae bacterium]
MKTFRPFILVLVMPFVASLGLMSCLHGGTISSIRVTPANVSMANGTTQQFIATAIFTDGTTLNWTSAVDWSSSNTEVATISNTPGAIGNGRVTSVAAGTAVITATDLINNLSGTATVTVANAVVITVTPAAPSIANGTTQQFTATETFTDGTTIDLTTLAFWNSSDTGVATISNASGSNGLATAVAAGTTSITATDLITNITGTATLTVTP